MSAALATSADNDSSETRVRVRAMEWKADLEFKEVFIRLCLRVETARREVRRVSCGIWGDYMRRRRTVMWHELATGRGKTPNFNIQTPEKLQTPNLSKEAEPRSQPREIKAISRGS